MRVKWMCPSCFKHGGAYVLGGRTCPFCFSRMKEIPVVLGADWKALFKRMLRDVGPIEREE